MVFDQLQFRINVRQILTAESAKDRKGNAKASLDIGEILPFVINTRIRSFKTALAIKGANQNFEGYITILCCSWGDLLIERLLRFVPEALYVGRKRNKDNLVPSGMKFLTGRNTLTQISYPYPNPDRMVPCHINSNQIVTSLMPDLLWLHTCRAGPEATTKRHFGLIPRYIQFFQDLKKSYFTQRF